VRVPSTDWRVDRRLISACCERYNRIEATPDKGYSMALRRVAAVQRLRRITRNYRRTVTERALKSWLWITTTPVHAGAPQNDGLFTIQFALYPAIGIAVASVWTLAGFAVALLQGDENHFVAEWARMQAFPCLALGVWLLLIAKSGALRDRIRKLKKEGSATPEGIASQRVRVSTISLVALAGSVIFINMGFNAVGLLLAFMWLLCVFICILAGIVTLHGIDLIIAIHNLERVELKMFGYAPARTPELRELVSYFTFFSLLFTVAYAFACVGTLKGQWTGNRAFIEAAQWFWPAIYVPVCTIALLYPHFVVHRLIRRSKESTLSSYQRDIDGLLGNYESLDTGQVERINSLAQVFDRISATPDYVIDFGIAARTILPHVVNLGVFLAKPLMSHV
jgi:hypothetical protein